MASVLWTVGASTAAIFLGVSARAGALVAFGAIGFVDALGSVTLAYHFRHALHHDAVSASRERLAHHVVVIGLVLVGCGTAIVNGVRLASGDAAEASAAGVMVAATSLVALAALSLRKRRVAEHIQSLALRTDSHLSAIGAVLAGVTLAGTAATQALGWIWADAMAAEAIGAGAIALGVMARPRNARD
ncbi:MAG: hypothetical protein ABR498_08335 [Candidatus Dormibacteria bacterium]